MIFFLQVTIWANVLSCILCRVGWYKLIQSNYPLDPTDFIVWMGTSMSFGDFIRVVKTPKRSINRAFAQVVFCHYWVFVGEA